MKKLLSAAFLLVSLSSVFAGKNLNISFEAAEITTFGSYAGSSNLTYSGSVPSDFRKPFYSMYGLEMGLRRHFLYNKAHTFSMSVSAPFQFAMTYTGGPSRSDRHNIYAFAFNVPVYLTANYGLGASKKTGNMNYGLYLSAGLASNRSFIRDRDYKFIGDGTVVQNLPYAFKWFPTLNINAGVRWQKKDEDSVSGVGVNSGFGQDGLWFVGLNFSAIVNFGR